MKRTRSSVKRTKRTVVSFACKCTPSTPDDCIAKCLSGTVDLNCGAALAVEDLNTTYAAPLRSNVVFAN